MGRIRRSFTYRNTTAIRNIIDYQSIFYGNQFNKSDTFLNNHIENQNKFAVNFSALQKAIILPTSINSDKNNTWLFAHNVTESVNIFEKKIERPEWTSRKQNSKICNVQHKVCKKENCTVQVLSSLSQISKESNYPIPVHSWLISEPENDQRLVLKKNRIIKRALNKIHKRQDKRYKSYRESVRNNEYKLSTGRQFSKPEIHGKRKYQRDYSPHIKTTEESWLFMQSTENLSKVFEKKLEQNCNNMQQNKGCKIPISCSDENSLGHHQSSKSQLPINNGNALQCPIRFTYFECNKDLFKESWLFGQNANDSVNAFNKKMNDGVNIERKNISLTEKNMQEKGDCLFDELLKPQSQIFTNITSKATLRDGCITAQHTIYPSSSKCKSVFETEICENKKILNSSNDEIIQMSYSEPPDVSFIRDTIKLHPETLNMFQKQVSAEDSFTYANSLNSLDSSSGIFIKSADSYTFDKNTVEKSFKQTEIHSGTPLEVLESSFMENASEKPSHITLSKLTQNFNQIFAPENLFPTTTMSRQTQELVNLDFRNIDVRLLSCKELAIVAVSNKYIGDTKLPLKQRQRIDRQKKRHSERFECVNKNRFGLL